MAIYSGFFRLLILSLLICAWPETSEATDLVGFAESVVDGDEFVFCVSGACQNIRLCGIDTPSSGKPGYQDTVTALGKLILGERMVCRPVGEGSACDGLTNRISRGRLVAQCFVQGSTVDVAGTLVEGGLACDRVQSTGGHYSKNHVEWQCPLR
jgi:endonuclease YncB( thermonuclease family)